MNRQEARIKIKTTCHTDDEEINHIEADKILCDLLISLGCEDVVRAWKKVKKYYA